MQKTFFSFLLIIGLAFGFSGCDVVKQVQEVANLGNCSFRLKSVEQLSLAGINVQQIKKLSDLSLIDAGKLTAAVASNQFPLSFTLNLEAKNPNTKPAGITKVEWILLIDDLEMTTGIVNQAVTIPANNGTATIPIQMQFDLKKALSGKSAESILNFGLNLAGIGNSPTRFTLKMKPTISVAGYPITYPGFLNVKTEFTGK